MKRGAFMLLNKDTIIGDILDHENSCQEVFQEFDMPCVDCPSARGETLEEACAIHEVDLSALLEKLGRRLNGA